MQTTQHARCPVLLHPACTTNPDAIRAVQQATGRFVVLDFMELRASRGAMRSALLAWPAILLSLALARAVAVTLLG